jgi:aryl-alcohol dehydrogenase-like predicted oxidoreductase
MDIRDFGKTGLRVSAIGFGGGQIGDAKLDESFAGTLLNEAADAGITLFDTARGYGLSEERIGRHLKHRRHSLVYSTKVGYGIQGHADWTYGCVEAGIYEAMQRLQTDCIDIVHLHSCPVEILERGEVIRALEDAKHAGKIRVAAYSGDNDALEWAVASGRFGGMMSSINICDQRVLERGLPWAKDRNMGALAKRPVANAPWRFAHRPYGDYAEEYWHRWKTMQLDVGMDWQEAAIRFAAYTWGVDSLIIGSTKIEHIKANIALVERGALDAGVYNALRNAFRAHDQGWTGQV